MELSPFRFHGWFGKRLTASYGCRYDFDSGSVTPANPIRGWLLPLQERAAVFARLAPNELEQGLVIRYDPGSGIGWHRDRPVFEDCHWRFAWRAGDAAVSATEFWWL